MATPGRRRLIAGGIASATVAGAIGATVLIAHGSGPAAALQTAAQATTTTSSAGAPASPAPAKGARRHLAGSMVIGRVASATATSLTVVDATGLTHTLSIAARTRVTGPGGTESITSIPAGELVIVAIRSPRAAAAPGASAASSTSSGAAKTVAAAVRDTGFKAA